MGSTGNTSEVFARKAPSVFKNVIRLESCMYQNTFIANMTNLRKLSELSD